MRGIGINTRSGSHMTISQPSMFAVPEGSYAKNASFGSGTLPVPGTMDGAMNPIKCTQIIRREDNQSDFITTMVMDSDSPLGTTGFPETLFSEVRIRAKLIEPISLYHIVPRGDILSPNTYLTQLPLFKDVDINIQYPQNGSLPFPISTGGVGTFKARLLNGGELALVTVDYTQPNDVNTTPITVNDLSVLFGEGKGKITFSIHGTYITRI